MNDKLEDTLEDMGEDAGAPDIEVPVLIVGGGPVGLAAAIELGYQGVECILVERRDGSIGHPKMNQVGVRTSEMCRRWGVIDQVRAQSIPDDFPRNIHFVTQAYGGHELARYEFPARKDEKHINSPEALQRCSQIWFDPILRDHARAMTFVDFLYETEFVSFEQDADGVTAQIRHLRTDEPRTVRAQYLIACDGAMSDIREQLGVELQGDFGLNYNQTVFFRSERADLLLEKGRTIMQWVFGENGMWADIVAINGKDLWRLSIMHLPHGTELTHEEAGEHLRRAIGTDFEFEVISILPWERKRVTAEQFSKGRVFLAGDAAKQMSPTGGFGMNTGIQEAVDVGWKLAAVTQGWGGDKLLASFDAERRPTAQIITDEAALNFTQFAKLPKGPLLVADSPEGEAFREEFRKVLHDIDMDREYDTDGLVLGYRYENSPIIVYNGDKGPPLETMNYVHSAAPGHRAPHAWLEDGASTLDWYGHGFVLVRTDPSVGTGALEAAAEAVGMPFKTVDCQEDDVVRYYEKKLILVRPDGHVAWRGDAAPDDPAGLIDTVRGA